MSNYKKTFTADGSSDEIVMTEGTFYIGSDGGSDFGGGGTITIEASVDGGETFSTVDSFTAEEVVKHEFVRGAIVKLVLSGSTSPDLDVRVSYFGR